MPNTNKNNKPTHSYNYLRRSRRTIQFATKVTPEFDETIRRLAYEKKSLISEMLDEFMAAYLKQEEEESKKNTLIKPKKESKLVTDEKAKTINLKKTKAKK